MGKARNTITARGGLKENYATVNATVGTAANYDIWETYQHLVASGYLQGLDQGWLWGYTIAEIITTYVVLGLGPGP